jgi:pyridoxal phosphate enzyme (YggS family)
VTDVAARWRAVRARVDHACTAAGRDPADVTIIAVSKTHPIEAVREAAAAGATDFGENYAQELATKRAAAAELRWHFIGRLQRNKAKLVAGQVVLVHAVDTIDLARELAHRLAQRATPVAVQPILLSVNVAGELTKGGLAPDAVPALARDLAGLPGVRLDGLMTMPPPADDPEASRPAFEALRTLRDRLEQDLGRALPVLSMGMSGDYEIAIACGATHLRIGTAIFGTREAA